MTQGCPIYIYATICQGILPLLSIIKKGFQESNVKNAAYEDDISGVGKLKELRQWWNNVTENGPLLVYQPEPSKSWLIVKNE